MQDPSILKLSPEEFDKRAKEQHIKFPDLLLFRTKEEIIDDFYHYYNLKRK